MEIAKQISADIMKAPQIKKYSAPLRFWHWANTIVISGSLITVLINSTITDSRPVSTLVKTELKAAGAAITDD